MDATARRGFLRLSPAAREADACERKLAGMPHWERQQNAHSTDVGTAKAEEDEREMARLLNGCHRRSPKNLPASRRGTVYVGSVALFPRESPEFPDSAKPYQRLQ